MNAGAVVLLMLQAAGAPAPTAAPKPRVAYRYDMVLKVADRDAAADSAIELAEKSGGYFVERTDELVHLKVPVESFHLVLAGLEPLGAILNRQSQAADLGETLDEQETLLHSREQMLLRYFAVLAAADAQSVVVVERQMTTLVQSIESLRGTLQLAQHQLLLADITIRFRFRDRQAPVNDGHSSFAWLNTVNLADHLAEFARE